MNEFELIERESTSMLDRARELVVTCDEEYAFAGEMVMAAKSLIVKISDAHAPNINRWYQGHKSAIAERDHMLDPVKLALELFSIGALKHKREQDRLAKEEADRIAAEKNKADEEARLKEAERLEAEGKIAEAERVPEPPPPARPTKFVSPMPRVEGLSTKKVWRGRIVAPNKVSRNFCLPDQALINRQILAFFRYVDKPSADQIKALEDEIGGIVIEEVEGFAGRVR